MRFLHNGTWKEYIPKLGDAIAAVATPIARTLKLPCIDSQTQDLSPESGCAKRKLKLNNLFMTKLNCIITASDDNNLIFETRGFKAVTKVIPRDDKAPTALFAAIEAAIKLNEPPIQSTPNG